MSRNRIHFLGPALDLTLKQRAEEIYRIHYEISKLLKKSEWIISDKILINIANKEDTTSKILKVFKKTVRRNTILKDVPDDYLGTSTSLSIYNIKYDDNSLIFRYLLGRKSEISRYSEALIYNYEMLIDILGFTVFKDFIKDIAVLLSATIIEVRDHELADELQKLLDSSVDVQVIDNNL